MFRLWRSWGCHFELLAPPDGGGGGGGDDPPIDPSAHPDYDVDDAALAADDPDRQQTGGTPPAPVQQPSRRTPAVAGQDPRQTAFTPEQHEQRYTTLQTQLTTQTQQFQQLQAQNALLMRQIGALTGVQPPPQDPAEAQLTDIDRKAMAAMYKLFPKLRPLLDQADKLLGLPDAVQGFQSESAARWQDTAERMWSAFDKGIAKLYNLQQGQALHDSAKKMLDTAFVTFLETDKNASARYRAGDVTVVDEFVNMFRTGVIVPANRPVPNNNGLPPRRPQPAGPPRLPRGGPGSTVVGQQPQQPNRANAAEVHEAAADAYFAARG